MQTDIYAAATTSNKVRIVLDHQAIQQPSPTNNIEPVHCSIINTTLDTTCSQWKCINEVVEPMDMAVASQRNWR